MNLHKISLSIVILIVLASCWKKEKHIGFPSPQQESHVNEIWDPALTKEVYHDKILGMLIGSAIGDAMGAPTEMWNRQSINVQRGYVDSLDQVTREASPEGPWGTNMPGGSTTDDTRWKLLLGDYLVTQSADTLSPIDFANHIINLYEAEKENLDDDEIDYEEINETFTHMTWLWEWVKVARPYTRNSLNEYNNALSKFYGGEMACAGMLYAPMIGAYYPAMPVKAYDESYRLGIFDLGYARDITGLTAAYVSRAMKPGVKPNEIGLTTRDVDPQGYFKSRLIGRVAYRIYLDAKEISHQAKQITEKDLAHLTLPGHLTHDTLYYAQMEQAYSLLEKKLQDIPFHAAEIHLINLTALEFSDGDFMKAMEFVVNFGRDNDTVGAVTGAILGAYWGASKLPQQLAKQTLEVNKNTVGIDLEELANRIVEHRIDD